MKQPSAYMIVDASIARSAKDPARHPTSLACLKLARTLEDRSCGTGVLMTPILKEEWRRHASRTMTRWLVSMETRNKVRHVRDLRLNDFRVAISGIQDGAKKAAIEKDGHLSEAAIRNGSPVASRDDKQRRLLAELAETYPLVGKIQWLNPEHSSDWEEWIATGCLDPRYLCFEEE